MTAPRALTGRRVYAPGEAVHVGSTRWIIRTIIGDRVELEAGNTPAGIWWRTTLDRLPAKAAA
jgi:hypothetical protein